MSARQRQVDFGRSPGDQPAYDGFNSSLLEFHCLVICRCTTGLNYSQPRYISSLVSWVKAVSEQENRCILTIAGWNGSHLGWNAFCWTWLSCSLLLYCRFELLTTVTHLLYLFHEWRCRLKDVSSSELIGSLGIRLSELWHLLAEFSCLIIHHCVVNDCLQRWRISLLISY